MSILRNTEKRLSQPIQLYRRFNFQLKYHQKNCTNNYRGGNDIPQRTIKRTLFGIR